jgi:23S rRNA (guanosine2251-2'-O)-methyltransferase
LSLRLRNPHSILAVFRERPEAVIDVRLPSGDRSDAWAEVERLARARRVPFLSAQPAAERAHRRNQRDFDGGRGGVAEATVKERPEVPLETLFARSAIESSSPQNGGRYGLWLALDQIQDPHNVGAIFRTAAFFGVAGIVLTRERSAPLNGTVYDVASGGMEVVPFAHPGNLSRTLEIAKEAGLWILGTSEHAEQDVLDIDRDRHWMLVLGNEEKGLRRLTGENCDELCRIAPQGAVGSLNVSVAGGILMALLRLAAEPSAAESTGWQNRHKPRPPTNPV